jgi:ABC-type transport system involved in cytochrome c biogenesis permease subunit
MNNRWCGWLALALAALLAACSRPAPRLAGDLERAEAWPAAFVERFGALPLQHDGRTMPFSTLAASTLYAVHGRRDVQFRTPDARGVDRQIKLSPTEWLLDVWCFPDQAARYPLFRIENVAVLSALGFEHDGQKQGFEYLSYAQLLPVGEKLTGLHREYRDKPVATRTPVEAQLVKLFEQLIVYHRLHRQLEMLHGAIAIEGDELRAVFGGAEQVPLAQVLRDARKLRAFVQRFAERLEDPAAGNLTEVLGNIQAAASGFGGPLLLPPVLPPDQADTWHDLAEVVDRAMRGASDPEHWAMVGHLQAGLLAPTMAERVRSLDAYREAVLAAAQARGEDGKVALESYYYRANWHFHAMMTFVLGALIAAAACVVPRSRILWWAAMLVSISAVGMLVADLWIRCLITGHPPITRLYDTFLFIGGGAALTLLIAEWVLPQRIALALAPFVGGLLIMLARLFEVADGQDTMRPLQAVLLSNFWLGVHVPTMNAGYFAGVAAAVLGCAWIAVRMLRLAHPGSPLAKSLVRMTYGVTCFSLATSVVGTILGGVWANDSWGRFWGWDPKENGALLICLSQIALLHARMCGMVRDAGFVLWSVFTGMIVVFSWFHTNLLGVGLHAYGFSSQLLTGVWVSYSVLGLFLVGGAIDVLLRPAPAVGPPAETATTAAASGPAAT